MMKKDIIKFATVFVSSFTLLFIGSCSIGLGDAVDTAAPKIEINYPPKNAIVRDSFIAAGSCDDDLSVESVSVTVTETTSRTQYGPYTATVSKDKKSWSVLLNAKSNAEYDMFEAYKKWEFPDGDYIISAVSYDKQNKVSQAATLPISIDNTAPVLLVSKPLAIGNETASVYGRNLKIVGDISEEHETTKLTLYYKQYDGTSFVDSEPRTLEITGFGTMSADNPLTIAKLDQSSTEAANSLLTRNYKKIYTGSESSADINISESNKKDYYCGFLLEDNALLYRHPGDSGSEGGNKSSEYFVLSDAFNEQLFRDTTPYSLNARSLMLLLRGQSVYTDSQIEAITAIFNNPLYQNTLYASSTNISAEASSTFSVNPKNNPTWAVTNFEITDGEYPDYEPGSAVPLVLKTGGDGNAIDKSSIKINLYHRGEDDNPINDDTMKVQLVGPESTLTGLQEYTDGALKSALTKENISHITFPDGSHPILNHNYEFEIIGTDTPPVGSTTTNAIEPENGRYGFKYYSSYAAPMISFTNGTTDGSATDIYFIDSNYYSAAKLNGNGTNGGIIIRGTVVTSSRGSITDPEKADIRITNKNKIKVSSISITDSSDASKNLTASSTDENADVYFNCEIIDWPTGEPRSQGNGWAYDFTAKITKKNASAKLVPDTPEGYSGAYKYRISFVAEDSLNAKNDTNPAVFEFKVDNTKPEISEDDIVITPTVTLDSDTYVNGEITVSGSVSDVGSGFDKLYWKVDNETLTQVTGAASTWQFPVDTTAYFKLVQENDEHPYKPVTLNIIAVDKVGNEFTLSKSLKIKQSTDKPQLNFTNNKDSDGNDVLFSKNNKILVGSVTDDDGLASVTVEYQKKSPAPADSGWTSITLDTTSLSSQPTSYPLNIELPAPEGEYDIKVTATDKITPTANTAAPVVTIKKDNGAPDLKIVSPVSTASTYYSGAVTVTGRVKDGSGVAKITRDVFKVTGDGEEAVTALSNQIVADLTSAVNDTNWNDSVNITESGTYKVRYTAVDKYPEYSGHSVSKEITFSVDKEAPVITSQLLDGNEIDGTIWYKKNSGKIRIVTSDNPAGGIAGSGVVAVAYTRTDPETTTNPSWINMSAGTEADTWETDITFDDATTNHLYIKATDKAGNISAVTDISLKVDVTAPVVTVTSHSGNIYSNATSDLTITGTYYDNESGVEGKPLQFKIGETELTSSDVLVTSSGNNFTATIKKEALVSGQLSITGTDNAVTDDPAESGNKKTIKPCTIIVDTEEPEIKGLTLELSNSAAVYKKAGTGSTSDVYYLNSTDNPTLKISGTATDNALFKKLELLISATGHADISDETEDSSWDFDGINLTGWTNANVTLTAYDKAGNLKEQEFEIRFDETAPVIGVGASLVGSEVYNASSYINQTAMEISTYLTEAGSGLAKLEYRLYQAGGTADLTTLRNAFDGNTITWASSGKFNSADVNDNASYNLKEFANISGFKPRSETGSDTNYLLLRATDNCGNVSNIETLYIRVDQTAPTVVATSGKRLTNGTADIVFTGSAYDSDAGIKALRVILNGETILKTDGELSNRYGSLECNLAASPANTSWTVTLTPDSGESGSWFDELPANPVVAIEVEDKAENKAPNPTKIAVLDIDRSAPEVENVSPADGDRINGINTITGTTSDSGSVPVELSLYYAKATSDTAPAALSAYTRLKTITTASTPATPASDTLYRQSVSTIYNFSFTENFYDEKFIDTEDPEQAVWILLVAKDEAGNLSIKDGINPLKYTIDRASDRPTISFTDIELTGVTTAAPKLLTEKKIYINISDDDGIVDSAWFRTTRGETSSAWTQITLNSGSGNFLLEDDGTQNIEFKVIDGSGTGVEFTSTSDKTWERVLVSGADTASAQNPFTTEIPVVLDTSYPEVTITQIRTVSKLTGITETDWSDWENSVSFNKVLGGRTKKIQLKFTAIDAGSGVDASTVKAEVKLGDTPVTGSPFTATKLETPENTYVVELPCNTGTGVLNVKIIAKDNVTPEKREGSTEKQFDIDNTLPEIHVESPGSDSEQSGSITAIGYVTESVKLSYAISPVSTDPDEYTASTAFSYFKKDSSTGETDTISLPATDKSGAAITPASSLHTLCAYKDYSAASTDRVSTFYVYFDGTDTAPNHTGLLNSWLKDLGITTETDLSSTSNSFDDIVRLYLHLKAEDAAGNVSELAYPFVIDPQGDRPKVDFSYPSTDNPTLGGSINIIGSVTGKTSNYDIYMQIDQDGDGDWDDTDKTTLESDDYGYTLTAIPGLTGQYGIQIPVNGTVWSKKINENGEFNPAEGETRKIKIRLYAIDSEGRISSAKTRTIHVDNDIPVIKQDIQLVQWNAGKDGSNGFTVAASASGEGIITFADGAVKAMRGYSEGMNVAGEWYVVGVVSDDSGISEVRKGGENGTLFTQTLTAGSIIKPYTVTKNGVSSTNYAFCFPIGSNTLNAVGTSEVKFYAKDTGTGEKAKPVSKTFKINYDNKAPEVTSPIANGLKILNNNGYYNFGTEAFEKSVDGANQSGIERIVFYFTREISGHTDVLNPMIRSEKTGNVMDYTDFTLGEEGLVWSQPVTVTDQNETILTVASLPVYAHKGGIVKVNGTIYKINSITGNALTLSDNPGEADSVLFTVAGVIDSSAPEDIPGDAEKILEDYGYGYPVSTHDDGDLIPESCIKSGTKCTWEANINSKNMSDGPVTLHYIVFDKAGNFTDLEATGIVQNNSPRLAGASIGTDDDGDGEFDTAEYKSFSKLYAGGYNGVNKITELLIPTEATDAAPVSAITIKRKTVIKPEIIGGNGTVGYTYSVYKRNEADTGWETSAYKTPVTSPVDLGEGTEDSDDEVDLGTDGGIILTVKDLLSSGVADGNNQKFSFVIWDSTPGLIYGETTQSATLDVIMNVALNDTTPATNKIIPFYWKSAKENSLFKNKDENGHIELSKDLPESITSRNPKVSGAVKLEGIAQDNSLLKSLSVDIDGTSYGIASYADGDWTVYNGTGWSAEIRQATYAEFKAAGYITSNPSGKKNADSVPYASQEYGHVVHWTMNIDTENLAAISTKSDVVISVSALDKGKATLSGSGESATVNYTETEFASNGVTGTLAQTGGNNGSGTYTCKYTIDVVPYITGIKTALSKKSKKTDTSEYDRTALGHYPVANTETIKINGFNLAGGTVGFTSKDGNVAEAAWSADGIAIPANAKSGKVSVKVGEVTSLNNDNDNNAQGTYGNGTNIPAAADYGKKATYTTFSNFYNRKPNITNNYILTDDVEIDIWEFNSEAAKPSKEGVISDPIMKINPFNNVIGFAYQSGPRVFSMAEKTNSYKEWLGDYDNLSATGFAYDSAGNTYGTALGGDINGASSVAKFAFMTSLWGQSGTGNDRNKNGDKHMRFEQIGQIGTKADKSMTGSSGQTDVEGNFIDKTRALSPSIAVTGSGTDAKVYLVYYDHLNQEIRFRWASKPKSGERGWDDDDGVGYINDYYGSKELGKNGTKTNLHNQTVALDKYSVIEFQIIAESKAYTYNAAGKGTETTSTALGKPGSYVSIDVIPEGTVVNGTTLDKDIIVLVWYDEENNRLMYTYNKIDFEELAAGNNKADFEGSAKTKDHWETPKQIFTKAGQYCQVKVDPFGGVHIAAYDKDAGDVRYAKLEFFNSNYSESTMSCVVDSSGIVGSNLTLDVALNDTVANGGKAIPYISYYGSIGPKMAFLTTEGAAQTALAAGTSKDMFTGFWEVTEIPTPSNAPKDRINVGVWKTNAGVINWSTTDGNEPGESNISGTTHEGSGTTSASGTTYGNGTKNPVVAYQIRPTSAHGYMETAQKR